MCWEGFNAKQRVADRDIKVYKILTPRGKSLCSSVTFFHYKFNTLYTMPYFEQFIEYISIVESKTILTKIAWGFHSYSDYYSAFFRSLKPEVIAECIIPKGSIYYSHSDSCNDIYNVLVSDSIIIKDIPDPKWILFNTEE